MDVIQTRKISVTVFVNNLVSLTKIIMKLKIIFKDYNGDEAY